MEELLIDTHTANRGNDQTSSQGGIADLITLSSLIRGDGNGKARTQPTDRTDAKLGTALARAGRLEEAIECFRHELASSPDAADICNNLGNALREVGQVDEAEGVLRRAIELRPDYAEAHNNLGVVLVKQHRIDEALAEYRVALKHKPTYPQARLNRALAWLVSGDFQRGWPEYEWRWKTGNMKELACPQPRWDGGLLDGRTLLLQAEQGLRDTLQFVRYARLARERGGKVLLRCRRSLHPLLSRTPGINGLVENGLPRPTSDGTDGLGRPSSGEAPKFDCWAPLLSLPRLMLTTLDRIPNSGPYLFADEQLVEEWRHRLPHTDRFKVGICWQGSARFAADRQRSLAVESFLPLAEISGVEFIGLQKRARETDGHGGGSAGPSADETLSWLTVLEGARDQDRGAFTDTAAIIMGLNLVITSDTSIAHLAGGLGMPVWVLLPYAADWRWLLDRDDSPWYPTMRLFRQSSPGDWAGAFRRVAEALRGVVAEDGLPGRSRSRLDGMGRPSSFFAYPEGARVWNRRGIAAAKRGRLAEAISLFRRAVRFQPDSAEMANNLGNALRNQGELTEAAEWLRRAIALKPDYAEAHHNLGLVLARQRRFDDAIAAFQQAIEFKPAFAECHNSLGQALSDLGRHAEAEAAFRRAVEKDGKFAIAINNLGNALTHQGKRKEAAACYERAVKLDPKFADAFNNLGNMLRELRHYTNSIAAFERAIAIRPNFAQAHNNMGITWSARRKYDEALACYDRALEIWPEYAAAHNNRGITLANRNQWTEATASYRRALELKPDYAEAMNNLGIVLSQQGDYEGALGLFKRAIELKPDYAEAFSNMGITLTECRRIDEALESYAKALEHKENYPDARMNRALSYLIRGDFERGWQEYEWRWKCKEFNARDFDKPEWDGSPLEGRRVMFHAEQGFGDTFQFIRYVRLVKEQHNCTVIVWCPKQLIPFLSQIPYIDELTIEGEPVPEIDLHLPLLSLPRVFGTRVETVPCEVPYLFAKPELVDRWRKELSYISAFKIGIAWKGNPRYRGDHHRSIPLEEFAPLADLSGVRLISLQKGLGTEQIAALDDRFSLTELPRSRDEKAGPFMDTAAIVKNLDLVISCDSSLTHLAGGLGVRVWLAQSLASDWRWLLNREDSPWYPTLRIFRQKVLGDWDEVFRRMAAEAQNLMQESGRSDC